MTEATSKKTTDPNQKSLSDDELKLQGGMTWKQLVGNQDNLGLEEEAPAHNHGVWEGS